MIAYTAFEALIILGVVVYAIAAVGLMASIIKSIIKDVRRARCIYCGARKSRHSNYAWCTDMRCIKLGMERHKTCVDCGYESPSYDIYEYEGVLRCDGCHARADIERIHAQEEAAEQEFEEYRLNLLRLYEADHD